MICPDCGYDNIEGVDGCEQCGQPLVDFDPASCELEESISRHSIAVLSPKPAVTLQGTTTVRDSIRMMAEKKIGCVLVKDGERLAGVFTERDVLNRITPDMTALDEPVSNYMTRSPETIRRQDSIAYALHQMDIGGYRHMVIVDRYGEPTGVLSVRDILRFLCVRFAEIRSELK
jgi:CBS domain-containing protein